MRIYCYVDGLTYQCDPGQSEVCVYCGGAAAGVDHVPPRSVRNQITAELTAKYPLFEVSACNWCNSILGDRTIWTLVKRREFIGQRLRHKFYAVLNGPKWTAAELEALGPVLRRKIDADAELREAVEARLKWTRQAIALPAVPKGAGGIAIRTGPLGRGLGS